MHTLNSLFPMELLICWLASELDRVQNTDYEQEQEKE